MTTQATQYLPIIKPKKRSWIDFVTEAITRALTVLLDSWLVMLLIGVAHSNDHRIPAFGMGVVLPLVAAFLVLCPSDVILRKLGAKR